MDSIDSCNLVKQSFYLYLCGDGKIQVFAGEFADYCPSACARLRVWRDENGKTCVEVVDD